MLELKNVSIAIGGKILIDNLSFSASAGEMVCISGVSGCGKTMLLKAILGLVPVKSGFISIDGELVTAESARLFRRMSAYVPQNLSFPCATVSEMARLPFELSANAAAFSEKKMKEMWQRLDLDCGMLERDAAMISDGQRRRIMIASALMLGKKIIIIDEPASALDGRSSDLVTDCLAEAADAGATVIVATNSQNFASRCVKTIQL